VRQQLALRSTNRARAIHEIVFGGVFESAVWTANLERRPPPGCAAAWSVLSGRLGHLDPFCGAELTKPCDDTRNLIGGGRA